MESMRNRFTTATATLMDRHDDLALVLADIGVDRFRATGATERHGGRIVNVGIREQLMIGVTAGFAMAGYRPIAHTYAPFLVERAFEQIKLDLVHQGLGAMLVSIGASFDAAAEGRTHQAPGDVALLATLPDLAIHVPGHADEVEALLRRGATQQGTEYIRLAEDGNDAAYPEALDGTVTLRRGSPAAPAVIAVGPMVDPVAEATADLDVTLGYSVTVRPFDRAWVRRAGAVEVILVEPYLEGTSSFELEAALSDVPHRTMAVGVPRVEHRRYGTRHDHMANHRLDATGLRNRIRSFLSARAA
jgi:transketolase